MATPYSQMDVANRIAYDAVQRLDYDQIVEMHRTCDEWHDGKKSAMHAFGQFVYSHDAVKPSVFKRLPDEVIDLIEHADPHRDDEAKLIRLRDFAQELAAAIEAALQLEKIVTKAKAAGVSPFLLAEIVSKATSPRN